MQHTRRRCQGASLLLRVLSEVEKLWISHHRHLKPIKLWVSLLTTNLAMRIGEARPEGLLQRRIPEITGPSEAESDSCSQIVQGVLREKSTKWWCVPPLISDVGLRTFPVRQLLTSVQR